VSKTITFLFIRIQDVPNDAYDELYDGRQLGNIDGDAGFSYVISRQSLKQYVKDNPTGHAAYYMKQLIAKLDERSLSAVFFCGESCYKPNKTLC
jgi:hypothetical protein